LLNSDPYSRKVPLDTQRFYIRKTVSATDADIDALTRTERINLFLRCYKAHMEERLDIYEAISLISGQTSEFDLNASIKRAVTKAAPDDWELDIILAL